MPPTNEGNAGVYIGATGHRPLPKYDGRRPHAPAKRPPRGLDWEAIRAARSQHVEPESCTSPCKTCGEHSSELVDGLCPLCVDEAAAKFTVPTAVPEPPTEGKQGKPTPGSSAPRATQTSSTTGRAPVAGASTHQGKNPEAAQETRPVAASGPTVHTVASFNADVDRTVGLSTAGAADQLDTLIDAIAQIRATAATELARIENALEAIRSTLAPAAPVVVPAHTGDPRTSDVGRPDTATGLQTAPKPRRRPANQAAVDVHEVQRLRRDEGLSYPQIAQRLGIGVKAVRNALDRAGIQRKDGRATHSGGKPRDYDQGLVDMVRALYVDQELSKQQVADRLDIGLKTVDTIMSRHGIPARKGQSGNLDGAADLKARIAALGVTSHGIKKWALDQGLVTDIKRGIAPTALVDAYENAHPRSTSDQSGAPAA